MKLYNLEDVAQENIIQDIEDPGPINSFGVERSSNKSKFSGFKI
jgi:hypothetical protein